MKQRNEIMDNDKARILVETAEVRLTELRTQLELVEQALQVSETLEERRELKYILEKERLRFSALVCQLAMFKAKRGILTLKRLN